MAELPPEVTAAVFPPPKRVAVLGFSPDPRRPSHEVAGALKRWGYLVFPVNPQVESVDGDPAFASLAQVPGPVEIVVVFRRSEHLRQHEPEIVTARPTVVWLQDGVRDHEFAARLRKQGILLVQDDCIARRYAQWAAGQNL